MPSLTPIHAALALALTTGCGHAALVHSDVRAGEIALEGAYMDALSQARMLAIEHCRGHVALTEPASRAGVVTFTCVEPGAQLMVTRAPARQASLQYGAGR